MRRVIAAATLTVLAIAAGMARNPHHPSPGRAERKAAPRAETPAACDTICGNATDSVIVSGFEKAQKASRESMMLTNNTARELSSIRIEITYTDMKGRMLHKAVHDVAVEIPPGETRMVNVPSFDRQNLFYYHLSPMQARARQATPYDVKVQVLHICYPKPSEQ